MFMFYYDWLWLVSKYDSLCLNINILFWNKNTTDINIEYEMVPLNIRYVILKMYYSFFDFVFLRSNIWYVTHKYYSHFFFPTRSNVVPSRIKLAWHHVKNFDANRIFGSTAIQFLFAKLSFSRRYVTDYRRIYHYLSNCRYTAGMLRPKIDIDLLDV